MDNVTHTLIGVAAYRLLPKRFQTKTTFWASVVGNNVPDSDVLQRFWWATDDLSSIVHHRGYTHGLFFAIPLGILVGAIFNRVFKRPLRDPAGLVVGAGAATFHILADLMNSYGIHPGSPFFNRWFYGDSVFILEPLLWFALIPVAFLTVSRTSGRILWGTVFAALYYLIWSLPWLSLSYATSLSLLGLVIAGAVLYRQRAKVGISIAVVSVFAFFVGSSVAKSVAIEAWSKTYLTNERVIDIEATPRPGNPFCWRVWLRTENSTHWTSRLAGISFFPGWIEPRECANSQGVGGQTAELSSPLLRPGGRIAWVAQSDLEQSLHRHVAAQSCRYRRFLNFTRLPFLRDVTEEDGIKVWIAGDLRYDREEDLGFAEFLVSEEDDCEDARDDFWERPSERHLPPDKRSALIPGDF